MTMLKANTQFINDSVCNVVYVASNDEVKMHLHIVRNTSWS